MEVDERGSLPILCDPEKYITGARYTEGGLKNNRLNINYINYPAVQQRVGCLSIFGLIEEG